MRAERVKSEERIKEIKLKDYAKGMVIRYKKSKLKERP
jgi:hypothetical protein